MNDSKQRDSAHRQHVIVLGAGYGGLIAAFRLAPAARVTLIDPSGHFTERVRLHEAAARPAAVTHPLAAMLRGTGIRHVAHRATAIDPAARLVRTDDGLDHPYDRLVYALGSRTAPAPGQPAGTGPDGGRVFTPETADALRARLGTAPGSLAVVGGGLTGIELAVELAETHPAWKVRLLTATEVAEGHSPGSRAHVREVLTARGVRIEEGVRIGDTGEVDADAVVWAAAMVPSSGLAEAAGLALDPASGRIAVDGALRSVSHPQVYAAGDAAAARSTTAGPLRMGCAAALPTGLHAARSILAEAAGREAPPLAFGYLAQCVSLGRHEAVIQFVRPDDSPRERFLTGRTATLVKEQVVRSTVRTLRLARRHPRALAMVPGLA
jgi:NADH:ubiquinone reductase (H+-translocating)